MYVPANIIEAFPHDPFGRLSLYLQRSLRLDLLAGLTVAMIAIPQGMAYAAIAGVNPLYGLYTAIIPAFVGALWGSSHHIVTGPTNATALVTAGILVTVAARPDYMEFVFGLAILSGLIRLLLGLFNLGGITRYVSNSVLTGFLAGAGVLIILNQLGNVLAIPRPDGAGNVAILANLVTRLPEANPYVVITALLGMLTLVLSRRLRPGLPGALLAIGLSSIVVYLTGWAEQGVTLVGDLSVLQEVGLRAHLPRLTLGEWQQLLPSAGAIALLGLVEATSVARAIGLSSGQHVEPSREFVGQGLASLVGGFFQGIPSSVSPSRSAVNYASGARTRLAAIFSGLFVFGALLALSRLIAYIPVAGLAAVVIVSAYQLIDRDHIRLTWQSRSVSRLVLLVTFSATMLLQLHLAIYLGALLSIAIYLYESSHLQITYLKPSGDGSFVEYQLDNVLQEHPTVALINIEGALYFGATEDLEAHLEEVMAAGVRVLILRMRNMRLLASTGVTALEGVIRRAQEAGVEILVCGLSEDVDATLASAGIEALLGQKQVFPASNTLFASARCALRRAEELQPECG